MSLTYLSRRIKNYVGIGNHFILTKEIAAIFYYQCCQFFFHFTLLASLFYEEKKYFYYLLDLHLPTL